MLFATTSLQSAERYVKTKCCISSIKTPYKKPEIAVKNTD